MCLRKLIAMMVVVAMLCLPLVACTSFKCMYDLSEIKAIEIVIVGEVEQTSDLIPPGTVKAPNFDVVCDVQDIEQFMDDFLKMDCSMVSPPRAPSVGDIGIKIIYNNDEYEIICSLGQAEYRDGHYYFDCGRHSFDKTQFDELINKYK